MGTKLAPLYANIFMSKFEEKHAYTYDLQPKVWLRYIDDTFCIWQHGHTEVNKFTTHLNEVHETIKLTVGKSNTPINFLDTTVMMGETTLYVKPTIVCPLTLPTHYTANEAFLTASFFAFNRYAAAKLNSRNAALESLPL